MESWVYIILAILFWGIAPVFGKLGLVEVEPLLGLSIRSFGISLILLVAGIVSGELGNLSGLNLRTASLIMAEGLFAGLLGHFAYYYALKAEEVSRVVLLTRTAPVLTALIGIIFLGESVSYNKVGGMALIILGAILMTL